MTEVLGTIAGKFKHRATEELDAVSCEMVDRQSALRLQTDRAWLASEQILRL